MIKKINLLISLLLFTILFAGCNVFETNNKLKDVLKEKILLGDTIEIEEGENAVFYYNTSKNEILNFEIVEGTVITRPLEAKDFKGDTLTNTMIFHAELLGNSPIKTSKIKFYTLDRTSKKIIREEFGFIKIKPRNFGEFTNELDENSIFEDKNINSSKKITIKKGEVFKLILKKSVADIYFSIDEDKKDIFSFNENEKEITGNKEGQASLTVYLDKERKKSFSLLITVI